MSDSIKHYFTDLANTLILEAYLHPSVEEFMPHWRKVKVGTSEWSVIRHMYLHNTDDYAVKIIQPGCWNHEINETMYYVRGKKINEAEWKASVKDVRFANKMERLLDE